MSDLVKQMLSNPEQAEAHRAAFESEWKRQCEFNQEFLGIHPRAMEPYKSGEFESFVLDAAIDAHEAQHDRFWNGQDYV